MKDFNLTKYLRENKLGSYGMFNGYVDMKPLKEEEEYELDTKVPYEGPEHKLDGFGDEFDQVEAVSELEMPDQIYSNDWMNDSIDGKKVGNWTCYFDDFQDTIYWLHDNINSEDIVVYITPGWDGAEGTPAEVVLNHGEQTVDADLLGGSSFPDFESYAETAKPYLDMVEDKYENGDYNEYLD